MRTISPFLWFNDQAEAAVELYVSIFPNSKVTRVSRYGEGGPGPAGSVMVMAFELDGVPFQALNGGPTYTFTEAVSFVVDCRTQAEVDHYWGRLAADGGEPGRCAWLKDRFGVSWQIVPRELGELMSDPDREKAGRVMRAMLTMGKIDIAALQAAYAGGVTS